jgi:GMP synthase-like glutamine amidotransferase
MVGNNGIGCGRLLGPGVIALKILVVQHDIDAPAGYIGERITAAGGEAVAVLPHLGGELPAAAAGFDGALLLGGAMSARGDANYPYYPQLFHLIRAFAAEAKPVMGICLGAQLTARAWGKPVMANAEPEFGFRSLAATPAARGDALLGGLDLPPLMQFHYDTFELPAEATLLATGSTCANQAYRIGGAVWGFQFHLEATPAIIRTWAGLGAARHAAGGADPVALTERDMAAHMEAAASFAGTVGDRWMGLVAARSAAAA